MTASTPSSLFPSVCLLVTLLQSFSLTLPILSVLPSFLSCFPSLIFFPSALPSVYFSFFFSNLSFLPPTSIFPLSSIYRCSFIHSILLYFLFPSLPFFFLYPLQILCSWKNEFHGFFSRASPHHNTTPTLVSMTTTTSSLRVLDTFWGDNWHYMCIVRIRYTKPPEALLFVLTS